MCSSDAFVDDMTARSHANNVEEAHFTAALRRAAARSVIPGFQPKLRVGDGGLDVAQRQSVVREQLQQDRVVQKLLNRGLHARPCPA